MSKNKQQRAIEPAAYVIVDTATGNILYYVSNRKRAEKLCEDGFMHFEMIRHESTPG